MWLGDGRRCGVRGTAERPRAAVPWSAATRPADPACRARASDRAPGRTPPGRRPPPRRCRARCAALRRRRAHTRRGTPPRWSRGLPREDIVPAPADRARRTRLHVPDGAHVDVTALADGNLLRPLERLLLRSALEQVEAAQDLLRLRERAVHHLALAGLDADAAGLVFRPEPLRHVRLAGGAPLLAEPHEGLDHGL